MFISLTEDQEVTLCGGENHMVSYNSYNIVTKVTNVKKGAKKQTVQSTVNVWKKKNIKVKTSSVSGLLKSLGINLPSLLEFDW